METIEIVAIALGALLLVTVLAWLWSGRGRRKALREAAGLRSQLGTTANLASSLRLGEQEAAWAARSSTERWERANIQLAKAQYEVDRLGRDLDDLKARLTETDQELARVRSSHSASQDHIARLETERVSAVQAADEARTQLDSLHGLEQRLAAVIRERDLLSASVQRDEQLESELGALGKVHHDLETAHAEIDRLRAELGTGEVVAPADSRIARVEAAKADLEQRLETEKAARSSEQQRAAEQAAEIERLRAAVVGATVASSPQADVAALRGRIGELEAALAAVRRGGLSGEDYAVWERELRSRIESAVDDATKRLRHELDHLRSVVVEKERTIQRLVAARPPVTAGTTTASTRVPVITDIKGIGPKIATILAAHGVTTLAHVAAFTEEDIERLGGVMPVYPGRIRDDDWVGQARRLIG